MSDADFSVNAIIKANTTQFEKGMKNAQTSISSMSKSIEGVQKLLKTAFSVVGVTVGIKAVTDFGKSCVQSATDAVKTFNILDNTVKATGADAWTSIEKLEDASKSLSDSTNYSVTEIQNMQSVLLGFTNITGESFDEASKAVLDMATVMKMDLTSAVQTVGKALDDPITGLDSLRRQGFKFTDQQKQQLKYLVENGDKIKAQKIILDTLATSYGGAAKAGQDSFAKQRHAVENFQDTLGTKLIPVMQVFAESNSEMLNSLTNLLNKLDFSIVIDFLEQTKQLFSDFTGENEGFFSDIIDEDDIYNILNGIYKAVQICVNSIDAIIHGDWETVWDYAKLVVLKLVNSVSEALQKMVDDLGLKVNVAAGIIGGLATGFGILTGNIAVAAAGVGVAVGTILATNKAAMEKVTEDIQSEIDETEKDIIARTHKNAQDGGQQLLKDLQRTSKEVKAEAEKTGEIISDSVVPDEKSKKKLNKFIEGFKKGLIEIGEGYQGAGHSAEDFGVLAAKVGKKSASVMKEAFTDLFTQLGEDLVQGGASFQDYAAVAVQGIAQVLQALGAQLTALAAINAVTGGYGQAAIAAAGAAAAFVASGVLTAVSSAMKSSAEETNKATTALNSFGEAIESLEETLKDLIEGSTSVNGFTKAVTAMDNMIEAATANIKKAQAQLESFEGEVYNTTQQLRNSLGDRVKDMSDSEVWEYAIGHMKNVNYVVAYAILQQDKLNKKINQTKEELEKAQRIAEEAYTNALTNLESQNEELQQQIDLYKEIYNVRNKNYYNLQLEEQLVNVKNQLASILAEFTTLGSTIGDTVMKGLEEGLSKEGFLSNIKKIIKNNLLKIAVYTESFQSKLADIGAKLASALSGEKSLTSIRKELEELWDTASKSAEKAEKIIEEAFGSTQDIIDDSADGIEDSINDIKEVLTSFEQAMQNFFTSIKDTGASIANEIVNGLTSGLSQSDFLSKMQTWLRNNLIQMVVYTDSMKSEIQAISDKIAEIMGSGRMFTTDELHEIRRDLSYAYESATARMGTIDEILNSVFSGYATGTQNATAEFTTLGATIGTTIIGGLEKGLGSVDFLNNMKKIIRSNLLKVAVYTESFQDRLTSVGVKLASALSGKSSLTNITVELQELWDIASENAKKAEKIIEEAFGSTQDIIDDSADGIEDSINDIKEVLTSFEQAMQNFFTSIKDTGASIANEIVNGLTDGLSQSDFLSKMQTWLRNNLIQMVVYTDSMKSEIQAISDKIAEIMGSGRMFTTDELHEIRRDLSYAYESATARMGTIDEILSSVFSGYATGTQSATAGLHLVGEAGPELVRFRGGERVFNANDTRDILSGGNMGNNFNVTFVNTQDTTAMAMMNQLRQYNRELAINGIL